jgi:hypothetical protein
MDRIPAEVIAAVDDTAAWAHDNVVQMRAAPIRQAADKTIDQCYTALQQSLAHYRAAGRMSAAQEKRQHLMLRALFLKAEAALMLDEQWQAFGSEMFMDDGYRASRARPADVSACMDAWAAWDEAGHTLYQALLHRVECIDAEAKAVQS